MPARFASVICRAAPFLTQVRDQTLRAPQLELDARCGELQLRRGSRSPRATAVRYVSAVVAKKKTSVRSAQAARASASPARRQTALRPARAKKARAAATLASPIEPEYVERAARVLLRGDSDQDADPIVIDAVARIMERVADHAHVLEFGVSGAQRVAAAEALEKVQLLLVKLAQTRRAEFVELVVEHAARLRALAPLHDAQEECAIATAFRAAAVRLDRSFRRLSEGDVLKELARLGDKKRSKKAPGAAEIAGALSARGGAFNDRNARRAANAFAKAWR